MGAAPVREPGNLASGKNKMEPNGGVPRFCPIVT
jgi:hypothetical protein